MTAPSGEPFLFGKPKRRLCRNRKERQKRIIDEMVKN